MIQGFCDAVIRKSQKARKTEDINPGPYEKIIAVAS